MRARARSCAATECHYSRVQETTSLRFTDLQPEKFGGDFAQRMSGPPGVNGGTVGQAGVVDVCYVVEGRPVGQVYGPLHRHECVLSRQIAGKLYGKEAAVV